MDKTDNREWRILVTDDEPANLQMLMQIFQQDQYSMAFATSGADALEAVEKIRPDLILLDIMMPEMDGHEVCRRLKENEKTREIPVIFVTAMNEMEDETKGFELGAVDYITKPVRGPIVRARVKNHLELIRMREELKKQNRELVEAAQLREDVERITRHDLKNPISPIIGFAELLLTEGNLSEEYRGWVNSIKEAGYSALDMINRSLDLFKMEHGVYKVRPEPTDIFQVVRKILSETQELAFQKELSVSILVNGEMPDGDVPFPVRGEELLCYSMLTNLMHNAIEASPNGKQITVSLNRDGEAGIIRLHNEGVVPEEIRDRFFGKYATCGKERGTGLGTYSAKLIAETQKGEIAMTTSEADGTTITVRLPMSDSDKNFS
ncbi:hybrid sensor histidine kinase/response regulator [Desulfobacterales bacterium HSG2]|nr:hybrid sensor histidine kinase/response regulator [Desulfobacterales bacterium HSG2]